MYRNKTKKSEEYEYFTTNDHPIKVVEEKQALLIKKVYSCQLDFDCTTKKENDFIGESSNNFYSNRTKKFSTIHMDHAWNHMAYVKGEQKLFITNIKKP